MISNHSAPLQQKEFDAIDREYSEHCAGKPLAIPDGTVNANSEAYRKIEAEYFQKLEKTRNEITQTSTPGSLSCRDIQKDTRD